MKSALKSLLTALFAFWIGLLGAQELEVIELKGKSVDQVLPVLRPLLEPGGTLSGMNNQLFLKASSPVVAAICTVLTLFGYILSPEVPGVPILLSQVSRSFCLAIFPLIAYLGYREKRLTLELVKSTRLAAEHTALQEKSQWSQKTAAEVQDLYDYAPCGYHSLDSTGLIVAINQTESDWLGYSKEELIGQKRFTEFFTPAGIRLFKEQFPKVITDGHVKDVEFELIRKDGSTLFVLLDASALTDSEGRFIASRSTLIDITERKRVDQALRDSHQSLEALVAERTTALQASNQRLEQELAQSQQIQHALTASENRFRELVESLPLPIWTCLRYNPAHKPDARSSVPDCVCSPHIRPADRR